MIKVELELNESTFERARTHANTQHTTVEKLFADILEQQLTDLPAKRSSIGLFADEPDLMDQVMEMIRAERDKPVGEQVIDIE